MSNKRLLQIDLLKAFAIISVIILHTVKRDFLFTTKSQFHIWQAVPIFMILMGLNSSLAFLNKGYKSLKELYSKNYFLNRFIRIVVPFIVIFVFSYLLGSKQNKLNFSILTFIGYLPVTGPGNYYITILFQFILISPLVYISFKRNSNIALLACLIINLFFEFISPHVKIFEIEPYYYSSSIFRYLFAIGLGAWLAHKKKYQIKEKLFLFAGGLISICYLLASSLINYVVPFFLPNWQPQNIFSFIYALIIVLIGLRFLPKDSKNNVLSRIAVIGRASYHIFLAQILFFSILVPYITFYQTNSSSLISIFLNIIICVILGLLFYFMDCLLNRSTNYL